MLLPLWRAWSSRYHAEGTQVAYTQPCLLQVDMFSFGVVLWEIVTQETPRCGFLRRTLVPNECPQIIEELITSCLNAVPSDRPSAKQACKIVASTLHLPDPAVGLGASSAEAI